MNITQKSETLLITRDGKIDDEYYTQIYAEKRREALHAAGREILHIAASAPRIVGKGILYAFSNALERDGQI